jgi:regulator of sigma E protease
MDTIVNVSQFLLSLSLLIVLHELGHFLPAKWFKTRVEKFYLFFDFAPFKSLWKTRRGETEYGIGWLPLGGYVKISGMVDESMDTESLKEPPKPWEFRSKPAWQRLIIMLGGVTVNFLLGFFIFGIMLWSFGKSYVPMSELRYGLAMDSVLLNQGLRNGDRIVRIGDRPFERFEPGALTEALVLDDVRTITVERDGQQLTLEMAPDMAKQMTSAKAQRTLLMSPRIPFYVEDVQPGMPAHKAGVQKGDRIVGIGEYATPYYDEFRAAAQKLKDQDAVLTVLRPRDTMATAAVDTQRIDLHVNPEGQIGVMARTQGFFVEGRERYSFGESMAGGVRMGLDFLDKQLKAFGQMFKGKIDVRDNLGSLISIGKMYGTEWNWERFWGLTASLSILLAFMNLLPIPALDGGYVMFLLWEVVTGRKVSDKVMERTVTVGFFLLLALMIFAFGLDIWRHVIQRFF